MKSPVQIPAWLLFALPLAIVVAALGLGTLSGPDGASAFDMFLASPAYAFKFVLVAGVAVLVFMILLIFRELGKVAAPLDTLKKRLNSAETPVARPVLSYFSDIRDQLERLRELENIALQAKDSVQKLHDDVQTGNRFLAAMSHEIRTPMNAVLGMSELLLADALSPRQRQCVTDIRSAAQSLLSTVKSMPVDGAAAIPAQAPAVRRSRVLVVDDNPVNLRVAQGLLELENIGSDAAVSGLDALDKVEANDYSIIFMDHMMPGMDGVEATKRIRMMSGPKGKVPIVALTANVGPAARTLFHKAGMNDFIPKPMERVELTRVLTKWMPSSVSHNPPFAAPRMPSGAADPETSEALNRVRGISSIDVDAALKLSCGQTDLFLDLLRIAADTLPQTIATLRRSLVEKNAPRAVIEVHGLKSSLAFIGANELSSRAAVLEQALSGAGEGKRDDTPLLIFLDDLDEFVDKLRHVFQDAA